MYFHLVSNIFNITNPNIDLFFIKRVTNKYGRTGCVKKVKEMASGCFG